MTARAILLLAIAVTGLALAGAAFTSPAETPEERVERLSGELRCPVCQALSVRDSPSETARAMRELIAQRVAAGRSDQEIRDAFRAAYGDWILLAPPALSWDGLMWIVPVVLVIAGAILGWLRLRSTMPVERQGDEAEPEVARIDSLRRRVAREEALDA